MQCLDVLIAQRVLGVSNFNVVPYKTNALFLSSGIPKTGCKQIELIVCFIHTRGSFLTKCPLLMYVGRKAHILKVHGHNVLHP